MAKSKSTSRIVLTSVLSALALVIAFVCAFNQSLTLAVTFFIISAVVISTLWWQNPEALKAHRHEHRGTSMEDEVLAKEQQKQLQMEQAR